MYAHPHLRRMQGKCLLQFGTYFCTVETRLLCRNGKVSYVKYICSTFSLSSSSYRLVVLSSNIPVWSSPSTSHLSNYLLKLSCSYAFLTQHTLSAPQALDCSRSISKAPKASSALMRSKVPVKSRFQLIKPLSYISINSATLIWPRSSSRSSGNCHPGSVFAIQARSTNSDP
jgi:hypothetical protein